MTKSSITRAIWLAFAVLPSSSLGYAAGSSLVYSTYVGDGAEDALEAADATAGSAK
ncbi:MAG TPA: hypothetical protein VKH43_01975 [Thermoanaerobaculia bacterium]|nr:hypothetical protein [Thermoanaerobaculia bacterium]